MSFKQRGFVSHVWVKAKKTIVFKIMTLLKPAHVIHSFILAFYHKLQNHVDRKYVCRTQQKKAMHDFISVQQSHDITTLTSVTSPITLNNNIQVQTKHAANRLTDFI
ncbi:hypothetical protein GOODEAATRI_005371 [Goodea atripinnis]|uniref:Uncharacterized protein n=1 Tax=Goodea atripinnis TaxID=208336 RepID=A0ABV0MPI6_9TELE